MAAIDIYKLEAFFYKVIMERIKACETIGEATNIYGYPGISGMIYKDLQREEEAGKKFKYKIRGFIIPHAKRYESIFEQARKAAFSDHVKTFRGSNELSFKFNKKMQWKKSS